MTPAALAGLSGDVSSVVASGRVSPKDAITTLVMAAVFVAVTVAGKVWKAQLERLAARVSALLAPLAEYVRSMCYVDKEPRRSALAIARLLKPSADRLGEKGLGGEQLIEMAELGLGPLPILHCYVAMLHEHWRRLFKTDATIPLGAWVRITGVLTMVLGLLALADRLPVGVEDAAVGAGLVVVGHMLAAVKERLWLVVSLAAVGIALGALAVHFHLPLDEHGIAGEIATAAITLGSVLGIATVLTVLFAAVLQLLRSLMSEDRVPPARRRERVVAVALRLARYSFYSFAVTNLLQAFLIAPDVVFQVVQLLIVASLCICARLTKARPSKYMRLDRIAFARTQSATREVTP